MLACVLSPFIRMLRRLLPLSATGAAVVLFLILTVLGLFLAFMTADSLEQAAEALPSHAERLAGALSRQVEHVIQSKPFLRGLLPEPGKIDALGDRNGSLLVETLRSRLGEMWTWVGEGLIILVLAVFLLAESEMLTPRVIRFFAPGPGAAAAAERTFQAVIHKLRAYLVTYTVINLALGVAVAVSLKLLGVEFPWALGAITAIASFIPYLGQVVSGLLIVLVSLSRSGSLGDALIVAAVYAGLVGLTGYVLLPIVMGRSLDLNGTTVLLACLFWGFLWGLVGLFLAIPITVSLKLVLQHTSHQQRWADLMSRDWQSPPAPMVVEALTVAAPEAEDVKASA